MIKPTTELLLLSGIFSASSSDAFISSGAPPHVYVHDATTTSLDMKSSLIPEVFLSALHHPVGKETAAMKNLFSSPSQANGLEGGTGGRDTTNKQTVAPAKAILLQSMLPKSRRVDTALFSGFSSTDAQPARTRFNRRTSTTMLRLSTTLRISNSNSRNKFSSILSTTLLRQPKHFHENVRTIKKKATLSSLILLAHLLHEEGENSRMQRNDYILRSGRNTITHLETHRTRLSESSTFEFDRREHKEVGEGEIGDNDESMTTLETISGIGIGPDLTKNTEDEKELSQLRAKTNTVADKKKEKKEKIVEMYSKSADAGDRAFATLLELNMVELSTDSEEQAEGHTNEEDNMKVVDSLIDEIDQVISEEASTKDQLTKREIKGEVGPTEKAVKDNSMINSIMKKKKVVEEYSKSSDAGDRAFATLLELNMIELTPDPEDPSYDHSTDDLFCP